MPNLMDLFNAGDFTDKKGKKEKDSKGGKKDAKKEKKGIRYPLPVHVSAGHIHCILTAGEYEGKTVSEDDVKKKIRSEYPELTGVKFNLVKFSNAFTARYDEDGTNIQPAEEIETEDTGKISVELPLDFVGAQEEKEGDREAEFLEEPEQGIEDFAEDEEDADIDMEEEEEANESEQNMGVVTAKGCWVKLELFYEAVTEEQEIALPVTIKAGTAVLKVTEDPVTLKEIREKWIMKYPEYSGCRFHYDDRQNYLIPYMTGESEIKGKKYKLPVCVGYLDDKKTYSAEDFGESAEEFVTQEQLRELYAVKHPEFDNAIFAYQEDINCLFPVLNFKKTDANDRYQLPLKVRGSGFVLDLGSEDFAGKTGVTLEEVRVALEEVYPEFSKERTEMLYDERGFVIPILKGSRKGFMVISERKNQNLYFVKGRDGFRYRVEQMPYGFFDCRENGEQVDFQLSAERIPRALFQEILLFFKTNPSKEAAAQIFYDDTEKRYEVYYPPQRAEVCSVVFERNTRMEGEKVLVMDVHSHGKMNAFFSLVDDHDEKGTRLYMVIGMLDREVPACRLRAGIAGHYKDLGLKDIFNF